MEFQRDMTTPTPTTNLSGFLQELDSHKEIWWALGARSGYGNSSKQPSRNYRSTGQYRSNYNSNSNSGPSNRQEYFQPGLQPVIGKPQFNAYSEQYSNNMATGYNQVSNDARALNAPPSQKMITQGQSNSGNGSASRANQQFRQPLRNIFPNNKGSFKPQKAYHTTTDDNSKDVNFSTDEGYWEDHRDYDEQ